METNFEMRGVFSPGEVALQTRNTTLRTLLEELSDRCQGRIKFIDPESRDVDPEEYEVLINGCVYQFLPNLLETELNEGDKVSITRWFEPLGGG